MKESGFVKKVVFIMLGFSFSLVVNAQIAIVNQTETLQNITIVTQTDIISFLSTSNEHSTLLELLKVSEIDELFSVETSYTLFAPTNAAFEKLPKATIEKLMLPKNNEKLKNILNYHILFGSINSTLISEKITQKRGKAGFKTENESSFMVFYKNGILTIQDGKGKKTLVEIPDKKQSNGIVHVIDSVLLPQ